MAREEGVSFSTSGVTMTTDDRRAPTRAACRSPGAKSVLDRLGTPPPVLIDDGGGQHLHLLYLVLQPLFRSVSASLLYNDEPLLNFKRTELCGALAQLSANRHNGSTSGHNSNTAHCLCI